MKLCLVLVCFVLSNVALAERCDIDRDHLAADYEIVTESAGGKAKETALLTLWRRGAQVAVEDKTRKITSVWEKTRNNKLKLTRYFLQYERGIEYQPSDLPIQNADSAWLSKYQLIDDTFINSLVKESSSGSGCTQQEIYKKDGIRLVWNPALKLIDRYTEQTAEGSLSWTRQALSKDVAKIEAQYAGLDKFITTDYIDIGDSESDPFFQKLINLGFVEHGASGFYDASGNAIQGKGDQHGEGHHHH